jgi:hypothetical protein
MLKSHLHEYFEGSIGIFDYSSSDLESKGLLRVCIGRPMEICFLSFSQYPPKVFFRNFVFGAKDLLLVLLSDRFSFFLGSSFDLT